MKEQTIRKEILIRSLQDERNQLAKLLIMQKNYSKIKQHQLISDLSKQISDITSQSNKYGRQIADWKMANDQTATLNKQQKQAFKNQLAKLDIDLNKLKSKLDKEVK